MLLGLMCVHSCEDSSFVVFGSHGFREVELEKGTVLDNMDHVMKLKSVGIFFVYLFFALT